MRLPDRELLYWLRWFCLPVLVFVSWVITGVLVELVFSVIPAWDEPWLGAICAFTWVLSAYFVVPKWKIPVAVLAYVVGAIVAQHLIGNSFYPKGHPKAYQTTHLPFIMALIGGLNGIVVSFVIQLRKTRPSQVSDATSEPTGAASSSHHG
jgi:hypothetical protein